MSDSAELFEAIRQSGIKAKTVEEKLGFYAGKLADYKRGKTTLTDSEISTIYILIGKEKPATTEGDGLTLDEIKVLQILHSIPASERSRWLDEQEAVLSIRGLIAPEQK